MSIWKDDNYWSLVIGRPSKEQIRQAKQREKFKKERERLAKLNTPVISHEWIISDYRRIFTCVRCGHEMTERSYISKEKQPDCVSGIELDLDC